MNSGMEAGRHRSATPIQTEEDPNISLADPAIRTERRRYLYAAQVPSLNARPPTFVYGDEEPISLEDVPVLTSTLEHTIIAPPEVMRRIEETKRERLAAEAEEAATGIKRPQEQGIWFSDETFVIGDPCPELLHYVEPYANGTKLEADGGGPVLKRHREDPNSAAADSSESGSNNN